MRVLKKLSSGTLMNNPGQRTSKHLILIEGELPYQSSNLTWGNYKVGFCESVVDSFGFKSRPSNFPPYIPDSPPIN